METSKQQKKSGALNFDIPLKRLEVTGEQSVTANTFISSFCQNNHRIICKDTLALNNKIRAISSYSAQLQSTSILHSHSSYKSTCDAHKRQMLWYFLPIEKTDEMHHAPLRSLSQLWYYTHQRKSAFTKRDCWAHWLTAVLWHLLKSIFSVKFVTDTWSDIEIRRQMSLFHLPSLSLGYKGNTHKWIKWAFLPTGPDPADKLYLP